MQVLSEVSFEVCAKIICEESQENGHSVGACDNCCENLIQTPPSSFLFLFSLLFLGWGSVRVGRGGEGRKTAR